MFASAVGSLEGQSWSRHICRSAPPSFVLPSIGHHVYVFRWGVIFGWIAVAMWVLLGVVASWIYWLVAAVFAASLLAMMWLQRVDRS